MVELKAILKLLLSTTALAVSIYGVNLFGLSLWPTLAMVASLFIILSVFISKLDVVAILLARIMGGLSLVSFLLLIVAASLHGSYSMSESNQIIAVALALMAVFGCTFFFIKSTNVST